MSLTVSTSLYRFDGLKSELAKMPNNTANIAFTYDMSLKFDDVSSFAQINLWLGSFWEIDCYSMDQMLEPHTELASKPPAHACIAFDCFSSGLVCAVEGRDRRIMASAPACT